MLNLGIQPEQSHTWYCKQNQCENRKSTQNQGSHTYQPKAKVMTAIKHHSFSRYLVKCLYYLLILSLFKVQVFCPPTHSLTRISRRKAFLFCCTWTMSSLLFHATRCSSMSHTTYCHIVVGEGLQSFLAE